ncbi:hypothetical protein BDB00DRAFT_38859 [Zychaea mexicana]|uniref:uncharacterized protein n=1 Tax=Zychaea mexicana TaxID=64656 RepID=UPI0022FEF8D9|nr:uncharacterized protein BDB00DRAFT_38859 [Zychaea mexicana]KAI9488555.1 hypothetical protein BDB00DRAFT_38859 [Zychaea mexicana]
MGIKRAVLIDEPFPDLFCGLCQGILDDPVQVRCPEDHMFCNSCIKSYLQQSRTCPHCLTDLDPSLFQPSKFVQRQIGRLRVRCPNHDAGCSWQGILSDSHPNECSYETCECHNAKHGCKERLRRLDIQHHECPYELLPCPNMMPLCKPFFRKDKATHEKTCRSYPCPFAMEGCAYIGVLPDVNAHCDMYCGKLHKRIKDLEAECERLKECMAGCTNGSCNQIAQQTATPSSNAMQSAATASAATTTTTATTTAGSGGDDDDMGGIDLLEQMLSGADSDYLSLGLLGNVNENKPSTDANESQQPSSSQQQPNHGSHTPQHDQQQQQEQQPLINSLLENPNGDLMDLSDCLSPLPFISNIDSKQPQQPIPTSIAAPKRSSNGKIIRYSKNVRLAHSALRMARQQQSRYLSDMNPFDALMEDLDVAGIKPDYQLLSEQQQQQQHHHHQQEQHPQDQQPAVQNAPTPASIISTSSQQDDISNLMAQHSLSSPQPNPFSFNNLEDVQKYLSDMAPVPTASATTAEDSKSIPSATSPAYTPSTQPLPPAPSTPAQSSPLRNSSSSKTNKPRKPKEKKNKKATAAAAAAAPPTTVLDARSPQSVRSPQPSSPNSTASPADAPKKRPMFVLASSYLANYGTNNSNSTTTSISNNHNNTTPNPTTTTTTTTTTISNTTKQQSS